MPAAKKTSRAKRKTPAQGTAAHGATGRTPGVRKVQVKRGEQTRTGRSAQPEKRWARNLRELSDALAREGFAISKTTLSDDETAPRKVTGKGYDIDAFIAWLIGRDLDDDEELVALKKEKLREELTGVRLKNQRMIMENDEKRGLLIDQEEALEVFGNMVTGLTQHLKTARHALAPTLAGMNEQDASASLDEAFRTLLEHMQVGGWSKKKAFWRLVSAGCSSRLRDSGFGSGASSTS